MDKAPGGAAFFDQAEASFSDRIADTPRKAGYSAVIT
jgi:hypothetical protein